MAEPTTIKPGRKDSIENQEEFLIQNRIGIVQKLRLLAKSNCMVTATFNGGSHTINTTVIDVIRDMDLIAMDYGPSESLNTQLLAADRILFTAELDGIDVQFSANTITKAKYQGESVFAIPIPESLLWIQRRQSYRVRVPIGVPAHVEITLETGEVEKFTVLDISAGGLAFQDLRYQIKDDPGNVLSHCKLVLPNQGSADVNLDIRNCFPINRNKREAGQRVGCAFVNLNMSFGAHIQRYIHELELLRRRTDD